MASSQMLAKTFYAMLIALFSWQVIANKPSSDAQVEHGDIANFEVILV
jgi:hypothetical protein